MEARDGPSDAFLDGPARGEQTGAGRPDEVLVEYQVATKRRLLTDNTRHPRSSSGY